ncbi:MAG: alpha/beta fold hydrolase [Streptosporangiaceae bacterium]
MGAEWLEPQARSAVFSRGLELSVCEWGDIASARLVLVGAHGFLDCAEFFAPLAAALRAQCTDLAFAAMSFAGHGRSSWADAYGWYDHTADLVAVARSVAARAERRTTLGLVGHSFGAVQVLQALQLEPGLAEVAVNLDAVSAPPTLSDGGMPGALAQLALRGGDTRRLPVYDDLDEIVDRRARSNPRLPAGLLRWLAPHLAREESGGYTWRVDPALAGWVRPWQVTGAPPADPLALTAALPHPVLTVTGAAPDHPQVRGRYPGDELIDVLPRGRHCRLPGAGHYVHLECPDEVAAAIIEHAARASAGRAA